MSGDLEDPIPGAVLALDLGERRIGVAVSDRRRILARPYAVIERSGNQKADRDEIRRLIEETEATLVVVGLPLSLSGAPGPAARRALEEVEVLRAEFDVPVEYHDERLSTVEALRRIAERNPVGSRRRPARRARPIVDHQAAAVILESYLQAAAARRR